MTRKKLFLIMFLSIIYFSIIAKTASATVGTDEELWGFGYHQKTQNIIFFGAGQEGSPAVWNYNTITNNLFENSYGSWGEVFYIVIDSLQKEMPPLKKVELKDTQLVIKQEKLPVEQRLLYEGQDYLYDVYPTKITIQNLKDSTAQTKILDSCFQDVPILLNGIYEYPDKNISIVVFRHRGVCFEGGYMKDTAFLFPEPRGGTSGIINIYTIQVVASRTLKNLDSIKNKLIELGQEPYIEEFIDKSDITWYRLRTGVYLYRSDAEEVTKKLKYLLSVEPFVLTPSPTRGMIVERTSTDKPDILKDVILPKEVKLDKDIIRDQNANKNIETNINNASSGQKEFKTDSLKKIDNFIQLFIIIIGFIVIIFFLGLLLFVKKSTTLLFFGLSIVSIAILGGLIVYAMFSTSLSKEKQKLKQRTAETQNKLIQIQKEKKDEPKTELQLDWKTYNDKKYRFTLQYPDGWEVNANDYKDQHLICFNPKGVSGDCTFLLTVSWGISFQDRYIKIKQMHEKDFKV